MDIEFPFRQLSGSLLASTHPPLPNLIPDARSIIALAQPDFGVWGMTQESCEWRRLLSDVEGYNNGFPGSDLRWRLFRVCILRLGLDERSHMYTWTIISLRH